MRVVGPFRSAENRKDKTTLPERFSASAAAAAQHYAQGGYGAGL